MPNRVKTAETKLRPKSKVHYWEAVGRRKTAVARVRLVEGSGAIVVNEKNLESYFVLPRYRKVLEAPLASLSLGAKFNVSAKVFGGGIMAQAGAMRHGIARALSLAEPDFKKRLRQEGFLTRDPRMVERKKYGLKKARRAPQWQKR